MEATTNILDSTKLAYTVQVDLPSGMLFFWSGEHTLKISEVEFIGGAGIFEIGANSSGDTTIKMLLGTETFTNAFRTFTGPANILIQAIGSLDQGNTWTPLDLTLRGKLSAPRVQGKLYEAKIAPERYYPTVETWSNEDWTARTDEEGNFINATDTIFSQQRMLSDGKIRDDFGDIPLFDINWPRAPGTTTNPGGGTGTPPEEDEPTILAIRTPGPASRAYMRTQTVKGGL